jgi:hypothetical protein
MNWYQKVVSGTTFLLQASVAEVEQKSKEPVCLFEPHVMMPLEESATCYFAGYESLAHSGPDTDQSIAQLNRNADERRAINGKCPTK